MTSPSRMTTATAPTFLLLMSRMPFLRERCRCSRVYPEGSSGTPSVIIRSHGSGLRGAGLRGARARHDDARSGRERHQPGPGPVADGVVAGVPHHPRVL